MDLADPRRCVVLGKLLMQQKRYDEARKLYADGTRWFGRGRLGGGGRTVMQGLGWGPGWLVDTSVGGGLSGVVDWRTQMAGVPGGVGCGS